ncbi:CDP-glucose 4,6-dehydratase [Methylomicrobium lacus]|uniref:CDP-glucose 4,6-dehydratase n=1 Tax=Methylomicrobium lacus TaxID=136992 RepID=UPI0035A845B6
MVINPGFWRGKRIFLTGHTGFKGGWLALWLQELGASVFGYALNPSTTPNLFTVANVGQALAASTIADIRDSSRLEKAMHAAQPDLVFHLAAQPLVRHSYADPVETYAINVMGTVNVLEAVRKTPSVRAVINVTTDKCYENQEWLWAYRENEPMGGHDPYSSSKACAELVTSAYRRSFLSEAGVALASVRSGNVIGGGDWSNDRLIPDILRAFDAGQTVVIRSPNSVRPWQYVLEPLAGYLMLGKKLYEDRDNFAEAWNFGPSDEEARSVQWIVEHLVAGRPGANWQVDLSAQPHEAAFLKLDSSKARSKLGWKPRWRLDTSLEKCLAWNNAYRAGHDMREFTLRQIHTYNGFSAEGHP